MNIKLDENQRDWTVIHLEGIKDFIERSNQPGFDWYSEGPVSLEFIEHLIAMFKEGKCSCGVDFSN